MTPPFLCLKEDVTGSRQVNTALLVIAVLSTVLHP